MGRPRKTPVCAKCGTSHFNFLHCDEVDAYMADLDARRRPQVPAHIRPRRIPEGFAALGDRMETLHRVGANRFVRTPGKDA